MARRTIMLVVLPMLLLGCDDSSHPHANTHPRYHITVTGHIAPTLKQPMFVGFWARYVASNPTCRVRVNAFEGVDAMPATTQFYSASPNVYGDYAITIPIDQYLPGQCHWQMAELDMTVAWHPIKAPLADNPWRWQVIIFGNPTTGLPGVPANKQFTATLNSTRCIQFGLGKCGDYLSVNTSKQQVYRHRNYHFIQNISA